MPPLVAAVAGAAFAATVAGQLIGVGLSLALSVGLSFAAKLLTPKPKSNNPKTVAAGINQSVRESLAARRIAYGNTRLGGSIVYARTTGNNNGLLYMIIAYCEGEIDEFQFTFYDDDPCSIDPTTHKVLTGEFANYVVEWRYTGTSTQLADPTMVSEMPQDWTSAHRLRGICYGFYRLLFDETVFSKGIPNLSAQVKGKKCLDTRTGTTGYTRNPAVIIRDFLTRPVADGGVGASTSEIDDDNFEAQANICDETVSLQGGGTEPRYTFDGVVEIGEGNSPQSTVQAMLTSCGGKLAFVEGKWRLFVAAYRSPTFNLTDDMIVGTLAVTTRVSRRDQFNAVKGTFRDAATRWQAKDYPPVTGSAFEAEDGGERVYDELALEYTTSSSMAQRLAKIHLYRSREAIEVTIPCNLSVYPVAIGDVITVTHARWGWSAKEFECIGWQWSITDDSAGALGITLTLRETSSTVYNWSASDEQLLAAAPASDFPSWNVALPPQNLIIDEELYQTTSSSGVKALAVMAWTAPNDAWVSRYESQYKLAAASVWTANPTTPELSVSISDLAPGSYNFRVRSVNAIGARSAWVTTTASVVGLSAPPDTPSGLSVAALNGLAILRWNALALPANLDVKIGGAILVNYTPATSSVTWDNSVNVATLPGDATTVTLPLQSGTYLVRARDSSQVLSASYASVQADQVSSVTYTNLSTSTEHTAFSGTKTNCSVTGGGLTITDPTLPATYLFTASMDLGSVQNVRLTGAVTSETFNSASLFDARTGNIDSWSDFDGPSGGSALVFIYYRQTQTDPAGSPTWTSWALLDATDARARGFQFKVEFSAGDPTWNVRLLTLTARADQPV